MDKGLRIILSIAVIGLVILAISILEGRKPMRADSGGDIVLEETGARVEAKKKVYEPAKDISTPDGFINTDGLSISDLIGKKVILVDFWTYSCINCQRTIPYLNSWHEEYADQGLVIIGVHTPEFEFEKDYDNVERAVEKFGIKYPVVLDNDYSTWTAYRNSYWPRKYLIDIDGFIVYDHIGEGAYEETEEKIVEVLAERAQVLGESQVVLDNTSPENVDAVDFGKVRTPETYLGYSRLKYIANLPSLDCLGAPCEFIVPDEVQANSFVLDGTWQIEPEYSDLVSEEGAIVIRFSASKVNLVAGSESPVSADIYLDGEFVKEVIFKDHDLYNLVDLKGEYGEHLLEIRIKDDGLQAFAFTFG